MPFLAYTSSVPGMPIWTGSRFYSLCVCVVEGTSHSWLKMIDIHNYLEQDLVSLFILVISMEQRNS